MANFESRMRTSYFNVKDQQAFQNELLGLESFNETIHVDVDKGICIYGENFDFVHEPQDDGDDLEVDVFAIIAKHLIDGEVVLVNSIGYEGYRYVTAYSVIITPDGTIHVNPETAVKELAISQKLLTREQADKLICEY